MMHALENDLEEIAKYTGRIPRWSFFVAIFFIGILLAVLSMNLHILPWWLVVLIVGTLTVPLSVSVLRKYHRWTRIIALTTISVLTLGLVVSALYLVAALFHHTESALGLFRDAILLWSTNIGVFSVWYWEIDRGGPVKRHLDIGEPPDFLFPQMTTTGPTWADWKPAFADYLFLAFNTNTAFSPTDTLVTSRRAKVLMMMQSSVSLIIVAIIAARAINIA